MNISLNLIRYLIVFRVNRSLVWMPDVPSLEMSLILGTTIANRLPTVQAYPWRKALSEWDDYDISELMSGKKKLKKVPDIPLPIESVIFFYPNKRTYGEGELIFWEFKMIGKDADHGLFLEVILPALEEIGNKSDSRWSYPNCPWGRFDIHSIYIAKGMRWEPLVSNGRLNLKYKATPHQWSQGLTFHANSEKMLDRLTWITPFDLTTDMPPLFPTEQNEEHLRNKKKADRIPALKLILDALINRVAYVTHGKYCQPDDFWNQLGGDDQADLRKAMKLSDHVPVSINNIKAAPANSPGRWMGTQEFASPIPEPLIHYLGLASVFHIGRYSHFGCGTFLID